MLPCGRLRVVNADAALRDGFPAVINIYRQTSEDGGLICPRLLHCTSLYIIIIIIVVVIL